MEQIRAANALNAAELILNNRQKSSEGDQLSGYHSLIITNGLLATLAYSRAKGEERGKKEHALIANALVNHIASLQEQKRFPGEQLPKNSLMDAIYTIATTSTPAILAMITDECMAYLNYLKRFVRAKEQ